MYKNIAINVVWYRTLDSSFTESALNIDSVQVVQTFSDSVATIIACGSQIGLDRLCWHSFENNRHLKELGIMLE